MNNNENKNNISFWELIKEDFNVPSLNDPALDSKIELIFNYPGVWAIINYRFANKLYKKGFKRLSRILSGISTFFTKTDIHPACTIGRRVFIDHAIGVIIGETAIIKDDVLIYQNVTLGGVSLNKGKRHPTIESKAIIGAGAKVLGDINIGENSKIGANSVVITDVPNNSTAVGVPARIIKKSKKCSVCRSDQNKLNHCELPDFSKEMFSYMNKRIQILEDIIKKKHNIDIEVEDTKLKKEYDKYISSIEQSEEDNCINKENKN